MSQYEMIEKYIDEFGSISPMEAFMDLGITKLSTRISEMIRHQGKRFRKERECRKNRYGKPCYFTRYSREM